MDSNMNITVPFYPQIIVGYSVGHILHPLWTNLLSYLFCFSCFCIGMFLYLACLPFSVETEDYQIGLSINQTNKGSPYPQSHHLSLLKNNGHTEKEAVNGEKSIVNAVVTEM